MGEDRPEEIQLGKGFLARLIVRAEAQRLLMRRRGGAEKKMNGRSRLWRRYSLSAPFAPLREQTRLTAAGGRFSSRLRASA